MLEPPTTHRFTLEQANASRYRDAELAKMVWDVHFPSTTVAVKAFTEPPAVVTWPPSTQDPVEGHAMADTTTLVGDPHKVVHDVGIGTGVENAFPVMVVA